MLGLGIPLTTGVLLVIPLSIVFGFIKPKYTCLAYVVPSIYIIDCILHGLNLMQGHTPNLLPYEDMIILIGILHAVEGSLTYQYGANDSKEVLSYNKEKIAGGYRLERKWCMPLLFFTIKGWYIPIIAVLAYSDETYTMKPEQKASKMGFIVKMYACSILGIGVLNKLGYIPSVLSLFFVLILHELMFAINEQLETHSTINTPPKQGLRIIATTESQDFHNPFNKGDVIEFINADPINTLEDYEKALSTNADQYIISLQTLEGSHQIIQCNKTLLKRASNVFLPPPREYHKDIS